jgi:hypothetical protein
MATLNFTPKPPRNNVHLLRASYFRSFGREKQVVHTRFSFTFFCEKLGNHHAQKKKN